MQPATKPRPLAAEITARQRKRWPYGKQSKKRAVSMSRRIQVLLEPYCSLNDKWFIGQRQVQKVVQRVAERARISQEVTPHVLRHYLPFRTMSRSGESLCGFGSEIADRVVPSTRASRDIVLCRLRAVQEGEESVAESVPVYVAAHSVTLQTADICCKRTFRRSGQNYSVVDDTLHGGLLSPQHGLMEMS